MININYPEIYFDMDTNQYYYTGETLICDKCGKPIENLMILSISWCKHDSVFNVYCINDRKCAKGIGFINERLLINVVEDKPINAYLYLIRPPILVRSRDSGGTVWSAAKHGNEGIDIIDRTRFALRRDPDYDMIEDQMREKREQLEMMDKKMICDESDFDTEIQEIANSAPMIEHEDKKMIGCDK